MANNSRKNKDLITFHFLSFMLFSLLGGFGTFIEISTLFQALSSGSIEDLSFEFLKYESGTVSYGYAALLQHLAFLSALILMLVLAINSLGKIIEILKD